MALKSAAADESVRAVSWMKRAASVRTFQALSNPHFRVLSLGIVASNMAMTMFILARGYLAFELSGSATVLGLVMTARGVPQLLLSPLGGVVADRVDKRRFLIYGQAGMA